MPKSWGISIPINGSISKNQSRPKYFSGEDILVDPDNTPDSIMILSSQASVNTTLRKSGKADNSLVKYTLDNMSLSFSASQVQSSDVTYKNKWSENYTGKFCYIIPFSRINYLKHFRWI